MICPFCQRETNFVKNPDTNALQCPLVDCPGRDFEVPSLYTRDYEKHQPIAMSIIGPTNHGKTMFIEGLLTHLEEHVTWTRFSTQWMDETNMAEMRQRLREIRGTGAVARATRGVFPSPRILRLRNIPKIGGCQLLMYDTGGESFRNAEAIQDAGRYVRHSKAVVWIVSLTDLSYPQELGDFMTSYAAAMEKMGTDPKTQSVIIALTKGDRLANPGSYTEAAINFPALPAEAKAFLEDDRLDPGMGESWDILEKVHASLEAWFPKTPIRNSINLILASFRDVRFCILSAQGSEAVNEQLEFQIMPRGILSPLFWLWRIARPGVWFQTAEGQRELHYDFLSAIEAAPEKATIELDACTITLTQSLKLNKRLTIVGRGPAQTRIESSGEKYALGLSSPMMKFEGISFGRTGEVPGDLFRVSGGVVTFVNCDISGAKAGAKDVPGYGIAVLGTGEVYLDRCTISKNASTGIRLVEASSKATLKNCQITKNRVGVAISGGSLELLQSQVSDNTNYGIEINADGKVKASQTTFRKNGKSGIRLDDTSTTEARIELVEITVEEHTERGLDLQGQGKLAAKGLTCRKNGQAGIRAIDMVSIEVRSSTISGSQFGIVLTGSARGMIHEAMIEGNVDSGIMFAGTATGIVLHSTLRQHGVAGLRLEGTSVVEHAHNTFDANTGGNMVVGTQANLREYRPPTVEAPPPKPDVDKRDAKKRKSWW